MNSKIYDVLIIGGGPAGLTAAIYTSRAELSTFVFAGNPPGGQLMWTTEVENYPGFPKGVQGPELVNLMREQAKRFGTEFLDENVIKVEKCVEGFCIETEDTQTFKGKTVIVATGASAKWLGLENEQRLRSKGVSACATCDGFFFKDKVVAVVGGGDAAMEESNFLTKFATKVYVLVRGDKESMKASKIMQTRAYSNEKIEFIFNTEVTDVLGENFVSGLKLLNSKTNEESTLEVQGLFVAIGHNPNTGFLKDVIEIDHVGYAVTKENTNSSLNGIFISGDVHDYRYRQAITAAGYGCMAALDAEKYLASKEDSE
ncbi:MAG: thioredoxin-disulfide reductase [Patescibacteria group bacterium]